MFCALLWLLDEYWSYTLFTLCSVVAYEATTVFQRTRTQKMLGGMAAAASPIYVYRSVLMCFYLSFSFVPFLRFVNALRDKTVVNFLIFFTFPLSTSLHHRCNTWKVTTTKELLPGDIISLAFKKRSNKKVPVKVAPPAIANAAAAGAEGNNVGTV